MIDLWVGQDVLGYRVLVMAGDRSRLGLSYKIGIDALFCCSFDMLSATGYRPLQAGGTTGS